MVVKVWGTVNSEEIVFYLDQETGLWECVIPQVDDGEYIIDLYAIDEAGNKAYTATILYTVDSKHLRFEFSILKVSKTMAFYMREFKMELVSCEKVEDYILVPVKCEICGGDVYGLD